MKCTQEHAARGLQQHQTQSEIPTSMGVEQLIVEMDGSMIPRSENGSDYCPRSENRSAQNSYSRLAISSLLIVLVSFIFTILLTIRWKLF